MSNLLIYFLIWAGVDFVSASASGVDREVSSGLLIFYSTPGKPNNVLKLLLMFPCSMLRA